MDNRIVSEISEGIRVPPFLILDYLPLTLIAVSSGIAGSTIAKNYRGFVIHQGYPEEIILALHLETDKICLCISPKGGFLLKIE